MSRNINLILIIFFSSFWATTLAKPLSSKEQLIVTNCKYEKLKDKANLLAQSRNFSLIALEMDDDVLRVLHANQSGCGKFLNLDAFEHSSSYPKFDAKQLLSVLTTSKSSAAAKPLSLSHETQVQELLKVIDPDKIWQSNQHLTSYINRSAKSKTGVDAATWFKEHFDNLAQEYKRNDTESYFVKTGNRYIQPSVVTVIGKNKPGDAVIIGAHIDTLDGSMPGADDDASGISVALEVARVLLSTDFQFERPVYIIAYAAEERGLVGSSYVVQHFIDKKIPVKAVMQLDQAGYRANPKDTTIWLLQDYVDKELTRFTAQLLTQYVKVPVAYTRCGYACSDHANWSQEGFSACYPSATTLDDDNPYVHTSEDKLEILNLDHMVNFTRLGVAFAAELGLKK